jgi:hypothetical protein
MPFTFSAIDCACAAVTSSSKTNTATRRLIWFSEPMIFTPATLKALQAVIAER